MNKFIHKPGTGSLFQNKYKNKDSQPDYTGKLIVSKDIKSGDEIKIAAWINGSLNSYLSLRENTYEVENYEDPDLARDIEIENE